MATTKPIRQVTKTITPAGSNLILLDDGISMGKATLEDGVSAVAGDLIDTAIDDLDLGTASQSDAADFATASQGSKADTAVQPDDIGTMATETASDYTKTSDLAAVATSNDYGDLTNLPTLGTGAALDAPSDPDLSNDTDKLALRGIARDYTDRFTPLKFGATGDGSADDSADYALAEADLDSIFLPTGSVFNLEDALPTKPVFGPGSLKLDGVTVGGANLVHKADRSSIVANPATLGGDDWLYETFPDAGTANHGNTLVGAGIIDLDSPDMVRTTAYGSLVLTKPVVIDRVSAFGQGVLRHTKYAQRVDVFGSLTCQWGGSNLEDDASGKFYHHDLVSNGGGALLVEGDAGSYTLNSAWTASNLFGLSEAVGQSIVDWLNTNPWPTVDTDFAYIQAFGRDALCEIVKGTGDVAYGYRALSLLLEGNDNTAVGNNALFNMVFGNQNTAVGRNAGFKHRTGDSNVYVGRNAGYLHDEGGASIFIGNNAGLGSSASAFKANWSVFIGQDAGVNPDGTINVDLSNRLFIQDRATRGPLISGDFANKNVGINLPIAEIYKGAFHIYHGASGATGAVAAGSNGIVLENSDHEGITILTPNNKIGGLYFGDPEGGQQGGVSYNHSADELRLRVVGSNRFVLGAASAALTVPLMVIPGASVTPASNGQVTFELTSNTSLTFKAKGSDGTVRTASLTLA